MSVYEWSPNKLELDEVIGGIAGTHAFWAKILRLHSWWKQNMTSLGFGFVSDIGCTFPHLFCESGNVDHIAVYRTSTGVPDDGEARGVSERHPGPTQAGLERLLMATASIVAGAGDSWGGLLPREDGFAQQEATVALWRSWPNWKNHDKVVNWRETEISFTMLTRDLMGGGGPKGPPPVGFSPITQIQLGIALWNFQYLSGHQFYASSKKILPEVTQGQKL